MTIFLHNKCRNAVHICGKTTFIVEASSFSIFKKYIKPAEASINGDNIKIEAGEFVCPACRKEIEIKSLLGKCGACEEWFPVTELSKTDKSNTIICSECIKNHSNISVSPLIDSFAEIKV